RRVARSRCARRPDRALRARPPTCRAGRAAAPRSARRTLRRPRTRRRREAWPFAATYLASVTPGGDDMDRDELRTVQEPLKDQYRTDPEAAVVTLSAEGTLGEGISCSVATGRAIAEAGLHPASGGDGTLLCSGDMLLEALAACAGVTLRAVSTALGGDVGGGPGGAGGDPDLRGPPAGAQDPPGGVRAI